MGFVRIVLGGSFDQYDDLKVGGTSSFPASDLGHAQAVADAIAWLSTQVLPKAIVMDHRLQTEGFKPTSGFGRK